MIDCVEEVLPDIDECKLDGAVTEIKRGRWYRYD
jgi:hypothetical protein